MSARKDFTIDQGSFTRIAFVLSGKDAALDLTDYSAAMQIRRFSFSQEAQDTLTTCNGRLKIDGPAGRITATFGAEDTEAYKPEQYLYDLEIQAPNGEIKRVVEGVITVTPEITKVKCDE